MGQGYEIFKTDDGSDSVRLIGTVTSFHSTKGAIQESQHVFIENGFNYFCQQHNTNATVKIFEIGFGSGLNVLLTAIAATKNRKNIEYYSVDPQPLPVEIYSKLNYPQILNETELYKTIMQTGWNQIVYISPFLKLNKIQSGILEYTFTKKFDIFYFDAFSPGDREEIWNEVIYKKLYDALEKSGVLVTYCSKSIVRKGLESVGFNVEKLEGPPGKREIIRAVKL